MSFDTPLPPYNASDPHATFLNSSCLDLLLIEMVPMAYRLAHDRTMRGPRPRSRVGPQSERGEEGGKGKGEGEDEEDEEERRVVVKISADDEEEQREGAFRRLESLGYRVGQGLAERFSRDRPRFTDALDVIKFLCKDLWTLVFKKQIDNLKTNHRGVYVLTDNGFKPFARMSMASSSEAALQAQPFLWFPCGIIRGALASMSINATVQAEVLELPGVTFHINTIVPKT